MTCSSFPDHYRARLIKLPLAFERIYPIAAGIHHAFVRTLILRHSSILEYTSAESGAGDVYAEDCLGSFNVYGPNDPEASWDEEAISYANAPGNDTSSGNGVIDEQTTLLGQFQTRQRINEHIAFRTPTLTDFLKNDSNGEVTLIITRETFIGDSGRILRIASRENTANLPPTLNIAYRENFDRWKKRSFLDPNILPEAAPNFDSLPNLLASPTPQTEP